MILSPADFIIKNPEFASIDLNLIAWELAVIEEAIREYTNNNFQERRARFTAESTTTGLLGDSRYIREGDTIQITKSINQGLYVVQTVGTDWTEVDYPLFEEPFNLATLVKYPYPVIDCAEKLLRWKLTKGTDGATGGDVESETLGRHQVKYWKPSDEQSKYLLGYPTDILKSLDMYKRVWH
ncbi:MAG: hypothetical protein FWF59_11995 [Turicibacter sp.]|nr:hypothetical protein [Turicibacter sp.]